MKLFEGKSTSVSTAAKAGTPAAGVGRRNLVVGAGAAGAAAVGAYSLRTGGVATPAPVATAAAQQAGDGYQVTQHVLRYYETAKV